MPKNKNKPNAFLFFMLDWKETEERKGRKFPNGLKDVQSDPVCNELWKSMSDDEKFRYKLMEKSSKALPKQEKRTGVGESITELQKHQMKLQEFKDNMNEYISGLIRTAKESSPEALQNLRFYVIHVNYFYHRILEDTIDPEYYPAEIAIVEFSLEKGVTRVYNQLINEPIKVGFSCDAKSHSSSTHAIPLNATFGKSDYREILNDICQFIKPGSKNGKYPPLYTLFSQESIYQPAKSVLSRLCMADGRLEDYLLLYSFEDLFTYLHNAMIDITGQTKIEPLVAALEIKKDKFAYQLGLECEYHSGFKSSAIFCSQSYAKRWIFVLCSFCCEPLDIEMMPGLHEPENYHDAQSSTLSLSMCNLSLNDSRQASSVQSMTGVSSEYRTRVSERTAAEERRRRAEANSKPIEIIDYSKRQMTKKPQEVQPIERPLRAPHTRSAVAYVDTTDTESIDFSEKSFPSIGRGVALRKKLQEQKKPGGNGNCTPMIFILSMCEWLFTSAICSSSGYAGRLRS
ncbi:hypothetical protein QAD02_017127 [Eretmocerus hayati]|uniref:Uncharacterized protein n=1 Tax=Eretmocerus hayati TaxID=131215 RepID=A0ACC2PCJ8_9HYME|nr:hypothetical protein QAD02_017127 [Eretmocerus hayati]